MCMRHELSAAAQYSAPVSSTQRILSESMAIEVSAFLIANVPPKPQHSSPCGARPGRSPAPCGAAARAHHRSGASAASGRSGGTSPGAGSKRRRPRPRAVHEERRELEHPGYQLGDGPCQCLVLGQLRDLGIEFVDHPHARGRRRDDHLGIAENVRRSAATRGSSRAGSRCCNASGRNRSGQAGNPPCGPAARARSRRPCRSRGRACR